MELLLDIGQFQPGKLAWSCLFSVMYFLHILVVLSALRTAAQIKIIARIVNVFIFYGGSLFIAQSELSQPSRAATDHDSNILLLLGTNWRLGDFFYSRIHVYFL